MEALPAWDPATGLLNVLVDTPRGSRPKYKVDPATQHYTISHILPPGMSFPFDFGSIPSTLCDDGDPLDCLVFLEEPTFPGCLLRVRPIGVIEARQTFEGKTDQNDRLLGVCEESRSYAGWRTLSDVPAKLRDQIEHFFVSYNELRGRRFRVVRRSGPARAKSLVKRAQERYRQRQG
jgi:inorganic pyrophosphatase